MASRIQKQKKSRGRSSDAGSSSATKGTLAMRTPWWDAWLPCALAVLAFLAYAPSLGSDFVYDGRQEILEEGYITSISNLPDVLTLKVLGMPLILGTRPGTLLYLMLNAALWGKSPWGYHLGSNLLHAANVGLLFVLLRRLVVAEAADLRATTATKVRIALVLATLIFALHPIATEVVSAINYCSDLLVTFFSLLALLAATAFRPGPRGNAITMGTLGAASCFAAVGCKESGLTAPLLLFVYWFLFRRREALVPWLTFLGAAVGLTLIFLAARFSLAFPAGHSPEYLGGAFSHVLLIQPRLWIFMIGKLLWPAHLSADYTLDDIAMVPTPLAFFGVAALVFLQGWLASKSRIGAMGMAIFWLGLATVSNFMPLYRINADRFYYLPLAGVALETVALLLLILNSRWDFRLAAVPLVIALFALTWLTFQREQVFTNDLTLWRDTTQVSPHSWTAQMVLGVTLQRMGQPDAAKGAFEKSIQIDAGVPEAHNLLGLLLYEEGHVAEAIAEYQAAVRLNPNFAEGYNDLGNAYLHEGQFDLAITQYQFALKFNPRLAEADYNLGNAFLREGRLDPAMAQYQKALELKPELGEAHENMGTILLREGKLDAAIVEYQKSVDLAPDDPDARRNLEGALAEKQKPHGVVNQLQKLLAPHP